MVGWERRMWKALTEREIVSTLEHLRIASSPQQLVMVFK